MKLFFDPQTETYHRPNDWFDYEEEEIYGILIDEGFEPHAILKAMDNAIIEDEYEPGICEGLDYVCLH